MVRPARLGAVVDRQGLPTRCAKADAEGSLHFALRSIFCALTIRVVAPERGALGPRATDPIFLH